MVQLGPGPQQIVVRCLQLLPLRRPQQVVRLQVLQRLRTLLEKRHPEQVLEVPQASHAVLDVRLLRSIDSYTVQS